MPMLKVDLWGLRSNVLAHIVLRVATLNNPIEGFSLLKNSPPDCFSIHPFAELLSG